jgi:hypothetical protein
MEDFRFVRFPDVRTASFGTPISLALLTRRA